MISVTPVYAGLIALLFLFLSFRVVAARRTTRTSVGDGGNELMLKRMRVQANCAEYAPIGLILLALAELQGMPMVWLHLFGAMLLAGRGLHAWGMGAAPQVIFARRWGMYLTVGMIASLAIANIAHGLI